MILLMPVDDRWHFTHIEISNTEITNVFYSLETIKDKAITPLYVSVQVTSFEDIFLHKELKY